MKFGGSTLRSPKDVNRVCSMIGSTEGSKMIVVSAMNGITDLLDSIFSKGGPKKKNSEGILVRIEKFHMKMIKDLVKNQDIRRDTISSIQGIMRDLREELTSIPDMKQVQPEIKDGILVFGERISIQILTAALNDRGIKAIALTSEDIGLKALGCSLSGYADIETSRRDLSKKISPFLRKNIIPVITGFYGSGPDGKPLCFGRNGSDYSSAVIANLSGADGVEIWKDVPGFMSADPSIIKSARMIEYMTYDEAAELAFFGALIIHPRTIDPLREKKIPMMIRNVLDPRQCTIIMDATPLRKGGVRSISFTRNIGILKLKGTSIGSKMKVLRDVADILERSRTKIRSLTTTNGCIMIIMERSDLDLCEDLIRSSSIKEIGSIEAMNDFSMIGIVGEGLFDKHDMISNILHTVSKKGINIEIVSTGLSKVAYYFIVKETDLAAAIGAVHDDHIIKVVEQIQIEHEKRISKDISEDTSAVDRSGIATFSRG